MRKGFTKQKMDKWIKEGRGQGEGEDYSSWLKTWDVPALGRVNRIKGITVPRTYHLLSDNEQRYFTIADAADNIVDIKEQYPLKPIEETQEIAAKCGIIHPKDRKTKEDTVMSTDFVFKIIRNGVPQVIARTVKPIEELVSIRTIEKFEIERRYWAARNIDWGIVTEREISRVLAENLDFLRNSYSFERIARDLGLEDTVLADLIKAFMVKLSGRINPRKVCFAFDRQNGLELGSSLVIFKHLLATKQVKVDLESQKIDPDSMVDIEIITRGVMLADVAAGN